MLKTYNIVVYEKWARLFTVEAENQDEAKRLAADFEDSNETFFEYVDILHIVAEEEKGNKI